MAGSDLAGRTDFAGSYVISDINYKELTVTASATGYNPKTYIVGASPWIQTMNFSLTPQVNTGRLTGVVYDPASDLPLAGVKLVLAGDASVSATTGSNGAFTFNAIVSRNRPVSPLTKAFLAELRGRIAALAAGDDPRATESLTVRLPQRRTRDGAGSGAVVADEEGEPGDAIQDDYREEGDQHADR